MGCLCPLVGGGGDVGGPFAACLRCVPLLQAFHLFELTP